MGEQPTPAGLGRLFFCSAADLKANPDAPMQPLGEAVELKPGMLTYEGDDRYTKKGFNQGFTGTMERPSQQLLDMLTDGPLRLVDVTIERKPGRMPRKMKKAYRSDYPRNTKWTRKVTNYIRRCCHTIHNAEIVVTQEQRDRITAMLDTTLTIRANSQIAQSENK